MDLRRRRLGHRLGRWLELQQGERSAEEETEYRLLSWSIDFVDNGRACELATKLNRDFPINQIANRRIDEETSTWVEEELVAAC
ncbi:MAG: hypothetical protein ACRD0Z_10185 [Acidimicrobiales bacterium]